MDYITSMRVYVRVVELGSFTAAAEASRISATMVAKHVQSLEDRLKAKLLHRTTRRHSMTELGELYFERAKHLLMELEALEQTADELRSEPRGVIRVTAPVSFGSHALAPALARFLDAHPAVKVQLTLSDRIVDLYDNGLELAFRIGPIEDGNVIARPLAPYRMLICAAPSYLRQHPTPTTPEDLMQHNCLGFSPWCERHKWRLMDRHGQQHVVPVQGNLSINNGEGLLQAALAGAGIIMQPEILLRDEVAAGRLVRILPDYLPPSRPMYLISLPDRRSTPKLKQFIAHAMATFGEPPHGEASLTEPLRPPHSPHMVGASTDSQIPLG